MNKIIYEIQTMSERLRAHVSENNKDQYGKWLSIDGTFDGLRWFPEKQKRVKGSFCGRCGIDKVDGKCPNRQKIKGKWDCK